MKTCKPNDAAMPICTESYVEEDGLTKREYFAALAMQGLFANSVNNGSSRTFAEIAVKAADHLIEALNKKEDVK